MSDINHTLQRNAIAHLVVLVSNEDLIDTLLSEKIVLKIVLIGGSACSRRCRTSTLFVPIVFDPFALLAVVVALAAGAPLPSPSSADQASSSPRATNVLFISILQLVMAASLTSPPSSLRATPRS